MIKWQNVINVLGKTEYSQEFSILKESIGENPQISETSNKYNDPNSTKYYEFMKNGILINFRHNKLTQIHLCLLKDDDLQYQDELPLGIDSSYDKNRIISLLGQPVNVGGGYLDKLLGYINKWIAYYIDDSYSLRFEFNQNDRLSEVTLTILPI
ncbi:hypothetical protein RCS94_04890 [Orbaceae bacterium ac157xtp]